ncbi:hypothetical protein B484DRAFT_400649 [Ochromonadaceae sp. CCMP2298]|nr:hypothetical protein B484DRAFT_400649 [Ochromonadaceae sp. CCMP2298]
MDVAYLIRATDVSKFGTAELGAEHIKLSNILIYCFLLYVVLDLLYVALQPKCVLSAPNGIILHHLLVLLLMHVPILLPAFGYHAASSILVELNTLFLTLRRNVPHDSTHHRVYNFLFYASWLLLRLMLFPVLTVFYVFEYVRYSTLIGTYANPMAWPWLLQGSVTLMGFKWTYDILRKSMRNKNTEAKQL